MEAIHDAKCVFCRANQGSDTPLGWHNRFNTLVDVIKEMGGGIRADLII